MLTLPKSTLPLGVTEKSLLATALAAGEHALSPPLEFTAVTAAKYVVPVARLVRVVVAV
jgi:hypothetical protein